MAAVKILVVGDVDGKIPQLYKRVSKVMAKAGAFDILFCVGSFFPLDGSTPPSWIKYLSGVEKAPISTYIMGPVCEGQVQHYASVANGGDLCENITYLGPSSTTKLSNGLRVAHLDGAHVVDKSKDDETSPEDRWYFTDADVKGLTATASRARFSGIDVFLTSTWPAGVCVGSPALPSDPTLASCGSAGPSKIVKALYPRYHFAPGPVFYERPPFHNNEPGRPPRNPTRFLSVASVGNPTKEKWLYAFNLVPRSELDVSTLAKAPEGTTASPFTATQQNESGYFWGQQESRKRKRGDGEPPENYVCHKCNIPGHWIQNCPEIGDEKSGPPTEYVCRKCNVPGHWIQDCPEIENESSEGRKPPPAEYVCRKCEIAGHWIQDCPEIEKEKADQARRGPTGPCWFCLGSPDVEKHLVVTVGTTVYLALAKGQLCPGHVLILPIQHCASMLDLPSDVAKEVEKYKNALRKYYASQSLTCVFFERNFRSQHLQLQAVPIAQAVAGAVKPALHRCAERYGITFDTQPADASLYQMVERGTQFFSVELPDGEVLIHTISGRFPLQFGREFLASQDVLNVRDRINWKECTVSKSSETDLTKEFRAAFKPFE